MPEGTESGEIPMPSPPPPVKSVEQPAEVRTTQQEQQPQENISRIAFMLDSSGVKLDQLSEPLRQKIDRLENENMDADKFKKEVESLFPQVQEELKDKLKPEEATKLDQWQQIINNPANTPESLIKTLRGNLDKVKFGQPSEAEAGLDDLEKELNDKTPDEEKEARVKKKAFKVAKFFGIGTLLMFLLSIWRALKGGGGLGEYAKAG